MKTLLFLIFSLGVIDTAIAGEYVDPEQKKIDLERRAFISKAMEKCANQNHKTVGEREECEGPYLDEAGDKFPRRGNEKYAQKMYSELSKEEAEQELIKLQSLYKKVEDNYSKRAGIIHQHDILSEAWWIHENILDTPNVLDGDPWFIECKEDPLKSESFVKRCPLGKGGAE